MRHDSQSKDSQPKDYRSSEKKTDNFLRRNDIECWLPGAGGEGSEELLETLQGWAHSQQSCMLT